MQPVNNTSIDEFKDKTVTYNDSYTRFTAGPVAGVGIFWDLGYLSFATELTYTARYSLGRRDIFESAINFTFSPVIKF